MIRVLYYTLLYCDLDLGRVVALGLRVTKSRAAAATRNMQISEMLIRPPPKFQDIGLQSQFMKVHFFSLAFECLVQELCY